jgi:CRP-like cAMP-binding protein
MINVEDLKKQILFQGLRQKDYERLKTVLVPRHYEKGSLIYREGDPPEGIYLIKKGRVRISKTLQGERNLSLVIFRDGNYFGDISALEKREHSATATALTEVEIYLLKFEVLNCRDSDDLFLSCRLLKRLALIAGKNLRQMNVKYLRLEESF